jgi:quercetin dioxygenase-like cupin family protein
MARAGDELINPVTGLRTVFRQTSRDTDGTLLQVDWIGNPGWVAGPDHVHPHQEERFEILSGRMRSRVDGVERIHRAGDVIIAPAGSTHTVWNDSDDTLHLRVEFRPALRSEVVLETLAGLARDGKTNQDGVPSDPLQLALIVNEYQGEIYFTRPPLAMQRMVFGVLASIARLLGYRADHPYARVPRRELVSTEASPIGL